MEDVSSQKGGVCNRFSFIHFGQQLPDAGLVAEMCDSQSHTLSLLTSGFFIQTHTSQLPQEIEGQEIESAKLPNTIQLFFSI